MKMKSILLKANILHFYLLNKKCVQAHTLSIEVRKRKSISELAGFAQIQYNVGVFQFLLGDRFTVNDYFGSNNSARATLLVGLKDFNTIKFIFGQSFRAPLHTAILKLTNSFLAVSTS